MHQKLESENYKHGDYTSFYVQDPKLRHIHKASVQDRLIHHAVVRVIEPIFDCGFIYDSYSSRKDKGTHKAVKRLHQFAWKLSRNNTKTVWALKADIRRFFDLVDHTVLLKLIRLKINDRQAFSLIHEVISSYSSCLGKGLPLGNLTSQLFSNIYLNELDQFMKNTLRTKHYLRYADDFVILHHDPDFLRSLLSSLELFLKNSLKLQLHPDKIILKKWHQGIDFLGYISFPHHSLLRTKTKKRALKKIKSQLKEGLMEADSFNQSLQSYLGLLKHCRGYGIDRQIQWLLEKAYVSPSSSPKSVPLFRASRP